MTTLRQAAENYLALRRSLGFALVDPGRLMLDFAGHLDDAGVTHITIERALAWATSPGATPYWHWYRLCAVRGLAAYLHAFDPGHQIPPADLLPRRYHRAAPFLFTDTDIATLIEAGGAAPASLHALTYQTLIGLLAVTGIRPGEAYALDREHVDLDAAMLTIVNGKYGKSRELPLHPSTVRALDYYLHRRDVLIRRPIIRAELLRLPARQPVEGVQRRHRVRPGGPTGGIAPAFGSGSPVSEGPSAFVRGQHTHRLVSRWR